MSYRRFVKLFLQYKQEEKCDSNRKQEQGVKKGVNIGIYIVLTLTPSKLAASPRREERGVWRLPRSSLVPGTGPREGRDSLQKETVWSLMFDVWRSRFDVLHPRTQILELRRCKDPSVSRADSFPSQGRHATRCFEPTEMNMFTRWNQMTRRYSSSSIGYAAWGCPWLRSFTVEADFCTPLYVLKRPMVVRRKRKGSRLGRIVASSKQIPVRRPVRRATSSDSDDENP